MNTMTQILIVSAQDNREYWEDLLDDIEISFGKATLGGEREIFSRKARLRYDLIIIDVTNIEDVPNLVVKIKKAYPEGKILIATATPTWREAREAFYIGATDYIRKQSNAKDMIAALQAGLLKPKPSIPLRR